MKSFFSLLPLTALTSSLQHGGLVQQQKKITSHLQEDFNQKHLEFLLGSVGNEELSVDFCVKVFVVSEERFFQKKRENYFSNTKPV